MIIQMNLGKDSYDIVVERDALDKIGSYINLNRRVLVLTDSGVPSEYAKKVRMCVKKRRKTIDISEIL